MEVNHITLSTRHQLQLLRLLGSFIAGQARRQFGKCMACCSALVTCRLKAGLQGSTDQPSTLQIQWKIFSKWSAWQRASERYIK